MSEAIRLPSFRLDNRVAMVTGSGTGIGAGIASGFAEAGADLVLVGRTLGPLQATARRVESFGRKATIIACDLTDRTELRSQIASLSCLDILVNNAGTSIPEPILEVTDASLDTMVNLNVTALFVASQAATRKMFDNPDRRPARWRDRKYFIPNGPCRSHQPYRLLHDQTRCGRLDKSHGDRACAASDQGQQRRPDPC